MGKEKKTSLAKRDAQPALTYEYAASLQQEIGTRIGTLAQAFGGAMDATPAVKAAAYKTLYAVSKGLERTMELAKKHIKSMEKDAEEVTDKGSKELHLGGMVFPFKLQASGTDPKKYEQLLREKGGDKLVHKYMEVQTTVTYLYTDELREKAVKDGILTADEVKTCEHEKKYSLMPPKMEEEVL